MDASNLENQLKQQVYFAGIQQEVATLPYQVQQLYAELATVYPPGEALSIAKREGKRMGLLGDRELTKQDIFAYLSSLTGYYETAEIEDSPPFLTHTHPTLDGFSGEAVTLPLQEIHLTQTLVRFYFCQTCGKLVLVWMK